MSDMLVQDERSVQAPVSAPNATTAPTAPLRVRLAALRRDDHDTRDWNRYVHRHADGTMFHTASWTQAVETTFKHEPAHLIAHRGEAIVGVLPMCLVASRIAGRILVSAPYGVGGGIIADSNETVAALFDAARQLATDRHCGSIDFRSERAVIADLPVIDRYVGFERELPISAGDVLPWLPRKARAAARNARDKYKLTVSFGDEHLREVWQLYSVSMRRLGSICYPFAFFESLVDLTPDNHWTSIIRHNGRGVAGLVSLLFRDRVMPYFFGSTDDARSCSAANFAYLTLMERAVNAGYRVFDFGRSRRDNLGSFNFKRFQGFDPRPLGYQVYVSPGASAPALNPSSRRFRLARRVWPRLPLGVTQWLGGHLSRHIPG